MGIFFIAIAITIYIAVARNPYKKGTDDYQALRLCRIGLALLMWSFNSGLLGYVLGVTTFILALIGLIKGRTIYGLILIIGSVCILILGTLYSVHTFFSH